MRVQQYLRGLVASVHSSRYVVLWAIAGYNGRVSCVRSMRDVAKNIHEICLAAGGWLYLKNLKIFRPLLFSVFLQMLASQSPSISLMPGPFVIFASASSTSLVPGNSEGAFDVGKT